jgi:peptide/nickel transport system substrate-binding protein
MGRARRIVFALLVLLLVACSGAAVSPELPRPEVSMPSTTTVPPTTTTTIDPTVTLSTECPTAFCLVYEISSEASWSDGSPVTSEDFVHTFDTFREQGTEPGYQLVSTVDIIDDKRLRVVFSEPFGGWQQLFNRLIPASADSLDIRTMVNTGAFEMVEWVPGERIVLNRHSEWWASSDPLSAEPGGTIDRITFVFLNDPTELTAALDDGTVDVISTRADIETTDAMSVMEDVEYRLSPGPFWEHIDFHHEDTLLRERWLRQAIALAIDREKLLDQSVRLIDPGATGLDNTIWMPGTQWHEAHYESVFDPTTAETMLVDHSCSRDEDGIYSCAGRRLSFTWASTSDDPARQAVFESVREDLEAIGIELTAEFRSPSAFVNRDFLFGGPNVWQMINFSWRAPFDPFTTEDRYFCDDTDLNVNRYCSPDVERLVRSADRIVDPEERAAVLNQADRLYLEDLALIPLYQKPNLLAWRSGIEGPEPNWSASTDLWNVAAWTGTDSIVVGLSSEPAELDPLSFSDDSADMIMAPLLYGAFGMGPSQDVLPALVESATVLGE